MGTSKIVLWLLRARIAVDGIIQALSDDLDARAKKILETETAKAYKAGIVARQEVAPDPFPFPENVGANDTLQQAATNISANLYTLPRRSRDFQKDNTGNNYSPRKRTRRFAPNRRKILARRKS